MTSDEVKTLKVAKAMTLKSSLFFTRYHFKKRHKRKFVVGEHHKLIAAALEKVFKGETTRLIINIGPRYGKTEQAVKNFIANGLALNPASKYIHLSYSDSLALDNSEEIKAIVQSESFQQMYPEVQIKKDSKAKQKWYTTAGGGVLARSSAGQVTGFGAGNVDQEDDDIEIDEFLSDIEIKQGFGGAIVIDDPIKPDDANSEVIRSKINDRFDSTIRSRVNSKNTPIIIIMQRLHTEDLCGYLLGIEPGEWEVISLPAINEDGTSLWNFKFTIEDLNKLRKANPFVFDTQYMQDPKPKDGQLFPEAELKRFKRTDVDLTKRQASTAFVDVADTGEDNHSVPFGKILDGKIFIDDVLFTTEGTELNSLYTLQKINLHTPEFMQVESNFGGTMYIQILKTKSEIKINGITALIPMNASQNKHTRIITASGLIKEYFYFLDESEYEKGSDYDKFMKNLTNYAKKKGASKHDDAPDSLAGLARMIVTYYPHIFDATYLAQFQQ